MGEITTAGSDWLRNFVTDGVPASGANKPSKLAGRELIALIDTTIASATDQLADHEGRLDSVEAIATTGIKWLPTSIGLVRVRSTANVNLTNGLENGDSLNGVTLATGDVVFLACQTSGATEDTTLADGSVITDSPANGLYTVVASGAASRSTFADSAAELERIGFVIQAGTFGAGERWVLPLAAASINLGTTPLPWSMEGVEISYADEVAAGRGSYASLDARFDADEAEIDFVSERVTDDLPAGYVWGIPDDDGRIALGGTETVPLQARVADISDVRRNGYPIGADFGAGTYHANRMLALRDGQSLVQGTDCIPVHSVTQRWDNLMFQGGNFLMHPDDSAGQYNSLVSLVETGLAEHADGVEYGESGSAAFGDYLKQLIFAESGMLPEDFAYQLIVATGGDGGKSLAQIDIGTIYWDEMRRAVTEAQALCVADDKTLSVGAEILIHGEQDNSLGTAIATVKARHRARIDDLDTHSKSETGQTNDVQLILTQTQQYASAPLYQMAVLEESISEADMHLAAPHYFLDYNLDAVHINALSTMWLNAYCAIVWKRVIIDGVTWSPVRMISHVRTGDTADVTFHVPVKPLVFDTTRVASVANKGFTLFQSDGTTPITITSVSIIAPDKVRIVANTSIPAGAILRYAYANGSTATTRFTGQRGNLRDSQGKKLPLFDARRGFYLPMHNWAVHDKYTLS